MLRYEAPVPLPTRTYAMRRPRFWSRGLALAVGVWIEASVAMFQESFRGALAAGAFTAEALDDLLLLFMGVIALLTYRLLRLRGPAQSVRVGAYLELPVPDRPRPLRVHYEDVRMLGRAPTGALILRTPSGIYVLPPERIEPPEALEELAHLVRAHVAALPDGERRLALFDEWGDARPRNLARPIATHVLLVVIAIVLPVQLLVVPGLTEAAANIPSEVARGQYDRLVSASYLHGGLLHLLMNGFALVALGSLLEPFLGSRRFLILYMLSAFGGALASAAFASDHGSVGASTALFGLLGALGTMQLRFRNRLPAGIFPSRRNWIFLLGVNVLISLLPMVDGAAHLGGFVTGVLTFLALTSHRPPLDDSGRGRILETVLAGVLSVVTVGALATSAYRAFGPGSAEQQSQSPAVGGEVGDVGEVEGGADAEAGQEEDGAPR